MLTCFDLRPIDGRKSFYGKAKVVRDCGLAELTSYSTMVCFIDLAHDSIYRCWEDYSPTTMRHVNAFLQFYGYRTLNKRAWLDLPIESPVKLEIDLEKWANRGI